ncbi:Uncharacterized conserved protein YgbK, DUF1537 family [Halobacillus dabanensis]|uniref:Uncharacterized conserved protein YgbK, DUF1537 family n=1 Tax=Halobacillus dabanensis TaxID=240302 RepID=A0A1I3RZ71_HALDA|nr:four-carbon acid sugar kinase family protein [Halobacillus dabanensis]SFJ51340.1 Uncharacterized conserved protein YgbK, DUF1537 family [Halobacillus dabanensis]
MIGVIADDITGANDIGIMFSSSGYETDVYSYSPTVIEEVHNHRPNVLIFDTDSRLDKAEAAYQKVFQATKLMEKAGADQFFNKTCSVFRGNIGAEFDAMLDALGEEFAIVVLGFPKNGRLTKKSVHYVHGIPLADSQFKQDPVHPMTESNLCSILRKQTDRKVGAIHEDIIQEGGERLKSEIQKVKASGDVNYLILDVTDQDDLKEIAYAVKDEKVLCGSSALGEEIPKVKSQNHTLGEDLAFPERIGQAGMLCTAGSLTPQTIDQVNYMRDKGYKTIEFDTLTFMKKDQPSSMIDELTEEIIGDIKSGSDVIFHSSQAYQKVQQTKEEGKRQGWDGTSISNLISERLAEVTLRVLEDTGQNRFIAAGGDTSAKICKALRVKGFRVWKEIQPGLPSCLSHKEPPYLFILKSGSFGTEDFFEQGFRHLASQEYIKGETK